MISLTSNSVSASSEGRVLQAALRLVGTLGHKPCAGSMKMSKVSSLRCLVRLSADTAACRGDPARERVEKPCALPAELGGLVARARGAPALACVRLKP